MMSVTESLAKPYGNQNKSVKNVETQELYGGGSVLIVLVVTNTLNVITCFVALVGIVFPGSSVQKCFHNSARIAIGDYFLIWNTQSIFGEPIHDSGCFFFLLVALLRVEVFAEVAERPAEKDWMPNILMCSA